MEALDVFFSSLLIGLSIAAPVGPIGVLTIQRSLDEGPRAGFVTGLGAAAADAVYGAIGAFGVSWVIQALAAVRVPLSLLGGGVLLWMAWKLARAPVLTRGPGRALPRSRWRYFAGTFVLTLSNPSTILSFVAIFGAMAGRSAVTAPATMVLGVLVGSAIWWLLLSTLVGRFRTRFDAHWHRRINLGSAAVLVVFALWPLAALLG